MARTYRDWRGSLTRVASESTADMGDSEFSVSEEREGKSISILESAVIEAAIAWRKLQLKGQSQTLTDYALGLQYFESEQALYGTIDALIASREGK